MNLEMRLNKDTVYIVVSLYAILDNSEEKVFQWLKTKNLNLGGTSPLMLINRGMVHKVIEFIDRKGCDATEGDL